MDEKQASNLRILADHIEGMKRSLTMHTVHSCGTPCCAIGEAAIIPAFCAQGVSLNMRRRYGTALLWEGTSIAYSEAATRLFGTTTPENYALFAPGCLNAFGTDFPTNAQWAAKAREILASHGYPTKQPERIEAIAPALTALLKRMNVREPA